MGNVLKYDRSKNMKTQIALAPAVRTTGTHDGVVIDLESAGMLAYPMRSLTFVPHTGAWTNGTFTPIIEESDTGAFSGEETPVADAELRFLESEAVIAAANKTKRIGVRNYKRYLRFTAVAAAATNGAVYGALAVFGDPDREPLPQDS